jgi:hypothetical protein
VLMLIQETTGETTGGGVAQNAVEAEFPTVTVAILVIILFVLILVAIVAFFVAIRSSNLANLMEYGSFFIVAWGILAVLIAFLAIMLSFGSVFDDPNQVLAAFASLFGVIGTLVGTYFGVKASSDARQGAQELAQSPGGNTTPPTVSSVSPPNGAVDVDGNTDVTVTFSTNMNPATITPNTFRLESLVEANPIQVAGTVRYDPQRRMATFTPNAKPLQPGVYQCTVTTTVRDQMGRALAQPYIWQFTVA